MLFHRIKHMHRIGYSLPLGFLSQRVTNLEDEIYMNHFKGPDNCLERLKEQMVSSIEVRYITRDTAISVAMDAIERIIKNNLDLNIHSYLPEREKADADFKTIAEIINILSGQNKSTIITIHTFRSLGKTINSNISKTVDSINYLLNTFGYLKNFKIAIEIIRAKVSTDPSFSYKDLVVILNKINDHRVGFCWDIGHSYWNVLNNDLSNEAPQEFIKATLNTHIHDLSKTGQTHWPLTELNLPLHKYINELKKAGYKGVYNLELELNRWRNKISIEKGVFESISLLINLLNIIYGKSEAI